MIFVTNMDRLQSICTFSLALSFYSFLILPCDGFFHKIQAVVNINTDARTTRTTNLKHPINRIGKHNHNRMSNHFTSLNSSKSIHKSIQTLYTIARGGGDGDGSSLSATVENDKLMNEESSTNDDEEEFIYPQCSFPKINEDFGLSPLLDDDDDDGNKPTCTHGLVLMDAFCPYHGGYLSSRAKVAYNAGIVHCVSDYVLNCLIRDSSISSDGGGDDKEEDDDEMKSQYFNARIPKSRKNLSDWLEAVPFQILGIICESDSGLDDAENLGVAIGLYPERHDGYNPARRDKFLMNQVVGKKGLRVVKQKMCSSLKDAISFAQDDLNIPPSVPSAHDETENQNSSNENEDMEGSSVAGDSHNGLLGRGNNLPQSEKNYAPSSLSSSSSSSYCVVKPCRGVASDDVYFCKNLQDVKDAFQRIHHTPIFGSSVGATHESVLLQEFAKGTEYAIDIVSKNGEHKVAALWRYDKRSSNNAPFVYFATEIIDAQSETGQKVCNYAMKALDALDLKWGLTHVEVILDQSDGVPSNKEPVLVEVNCRQHNTDFVPLTSISIGYNSLDMLLSAFLGDLENLPDETADLRLEWDELPSLSKPRAFAAIVHLVCYVEGVVVALDSEVLEEIENLPSVLAMEVYDHFAVGSRIKKTIDIRSDSGWVHLMNDDEEQFIADYNRIVDLMPSMFIVN